MLRNVCAACWQELAFLEFYDHVSLLSDTLSTYSTFAGISVILFVFRLLKGLDFQVIRNLRTDSCMLPIRLDCVPCASKPHFLHLCLLLSGAFAVTMTVTMFLLVTSWCYLPAGALLLSLTNPPATHSHCVSQTFTLYIHIVTEHRK